MTPNQWVVAGSVCGAMVIAGLALGYAAGRAPASGKPPVTPVAEKPKAKSTPVAEKPEKSEEPPVKKTVPIKRPDPDPEPEKSEPEMKKPEPEKPEPKPEPKKPEPKKIEPKKTEVAKKDPPKKEPNVPAGSVTFVSHIQKVVQQKCILCHGEGSIKGKLSMKTLALMTKGGKAAGVVR